MGEDVARSCGSCTACCKVLRIDAPELQKPAGVWCPNCLPGKGCGIYDNRPAAICHDYKCLWLASQILPETARPEQLKVMFSMEPNPLPERPGKVCAVARSLGGVDIFERPAVIAAIAAIIRAGIDVHLSWGETKTLVVAHFGVGGRLKALDLPADGGRTRRRKLLAGPGPL